ncbi:hypothetical protein OG894_41740 [Streptomyces sp. NBC_01724]|uniref:hypothetical protein n=1 Tax=unclassified Streptomyces TaxID=2593676 RepID=UPI002E31376A|nr:hypothetical protein [Streptomyces sp. NBC_01724]WTE49249.1 hypothetical protein OG987_00050 [Streptomyces sp. NBC_01620]WTE56749.1 hypothetical protein OG987_42620 [Streptomyces sp. NBC_01620]
MLSRFSLRRGGAIAATALALFSGAASLASPASAASSFGIIPKFVAPNKDVSGTQGLISGFPILNQRDNSGLDSFERWQEISTGQTYEGSPVVFLRNVAPGPDGRQWWMDSVNPSGPFVPTSGSAVGTEPADGTVSQQWEKINHGGSISYKNVYTHMYLTFKVASSGGVVQQSSLTSGADFTLRFV